MRKLLITLIYLAFAVWIGAIWTYMSRTETHMFPLARITAMEVDDVPAPFVHRRLAIDTARLIAHIVPSSTWSSASDTIDHNRILRGMLRGQRMGWTRQTDPILVTMTLLIMLSALGFLIFARWLAITLYETPPIVSHVIALALGLGLLGGRGNASATWNNYPYDIPQSFMFIATATLIMRGNLLFAPMFFLASYSKETSVMLAIVFALTWPRRRGWTLLIGAAAMFVVFVVVRLFIVRQHPAIQVFALMFQGRLFVSRVPNVLPFAPVSTALRNTMGVLFYSSWTIPLFALAAIEIKKYWHVIPWQLRRMWVLPIALVAACMFKGWIEERRAYLEAMPYIGLILFQVILWEAGRSNWMRPRNPHAPEYPMLQTR